MIHCNYCNKLIIGPYVIDSWGFHFHNDCLLKCQPCGSCKRNLHGNSFKKSIRLQDDRYICPDCLSEGIIMKVSQMAKCVAAMYAFFKEADISFPENKITYKLADANELKDNITGITTKYTILSHSSYKITMLIGLSKTVFCASLAHELMHVYLFEKNIVLNPTETEGICELVSYFTFVRMNSPAAKHYIKVMELNPDPIYGNGFRLMKEKVRPFINIQNYLDFVLSNKNKPPNSLFLRDCIAKPML